ncbi:MAG: peptide ABC transporter substrate-binding protein, partial [Oscillochloris sp.]|nr:peptide ABC transporter substrate-binding protein [Oscillochloris sp.]
AMQPGGKLTILYWQAVTTLNPHLSSGTKDFDGATVILEPMARYNQNDELIPFLAAEIPTIENGGIAEDGTSVTWTLKPDLKWSDGTDFTVDDVIFTWQYCADEATACTTKSSFDPIANIEAVDDTSFTITWKEPSADPYVSFVGPNGMVLQQAQFGNCIGAAASTDAACQAANLAPIGTNAWQLTELRPGDTVLYERNPNFRDADSVFFDTVEIKGGGDATSAARAVCETQEVDFAWNLQIPKAVLEPILATGNCDALAGGSFGVERIVVNFSNPDPALGDLRSEPDQPHPFLTDLAVRQAISLAIDRNAIAEQLYGPTGVPTCNVLVVPAAVNSPNTTCERDVEEANRILDEAGYTRDGSQRISPDGIPLVVDFQTSINTLRQGEQAIIKANLAEIGITVNVKAIDASVFFSGDTGNPDTLNKFYADLQMYTNGPSTTDPQAYLSAWTCAELASRANNWNLNNDGRYCNPEYDALFAELQVELDPARRAELAIQMNDILTNDVAVIALINRQTPNAKLTNLEGPTFNTFDSSIWNIAAWSRN